MSFRITRAALPLLFTAILSGCGSSNTTAPPPIANTNTNGYGSYGSYGCGTSGVAPINANGAPDTATLYIASNGYLPQPSGDSISLAISYEYAPTVGQTSEVVASGNLNLSDILPAGSPAVCVSSNSLNSSTPSPGIMDAQGDVQMVLYGVASVTGGYQGAATQVPVVVNLNGNVSEVSNRFIGEVDINLGGQTYPYSAQ